MLRYGREYRLGHRGRSTCLHFQLWSLTVFHGARFHVAPWDYNKTSVPIHGAHRRNDAEGFPRSSTSTFAPPEGGRVKTTSALVNLLYDVELGGRFVPYVGAGIGRAHMDAKSDGVGTDGSEDVFAWQGIVGAAFNVSDNIDIFADYRYFQTEDATFSVTVLPDFDVEYHSHSLMIGLRWRFKAP